MRKFAYVFLIIGLAFIALGASGQRTFLYVGIAFLVVGALRLLRLRR